jgi:hypothetical protein
METSHDFVLSVLWLTARVVSVGTFGLYLVTLGNPRELWVQVRIFDYLYAAPPTVLFRWRPPHGYEVVIYKAATDEEEVKPALFQPVSWSPTYLLWPKGPSQPKQVMVRAALFVFLVRLLFFMCFFLGGFGLVGWLAVTESRHWLVVMAVLTVHQLAFAYTDIYFTWLRWWLFLLVGAGASVYLQGGTFETIAVCTVGALVVLAILGRWYLTKSWRFQTMRDLEVGLFDPNRRRKLW